MVLDLNSVVGRSVIDDVVGELSENKTILY